VSGEFPGESLKGCDRIRMDHKTALHHKASESERDPGGERRHIVPLRGGRLHPDRDLVECRDCQVSCQSACKTSCTVGNQRCPR